MSSAVTQAEDIPIRHFYHVHTSPEWPRIAGEHLSALRQAQFTWPVTVGIVGHWAARAPARDWFTKHGVTDFTEADRGWEDVTLRSLWKWAQHNPTGIVLYAHVKGSYTVTAGNDDWRQAMTLRLVGGWQFCLEHLEGVDALGCHWLTPDEYARRDVATPFFAGNFWWARCSYIAGLPEPVPADSRYDHERWIGLGNPQVYDLLPGWPRYGQEP